MSATSDLSAASAAQRREQLKEVYRPRPRPARDARSSRRPGRPSCSGRATPTPTSCSSVRRPGASEDEQGLPFVGAGGQAARDACSVRSASGAQRRVHRQHAQVPPAGQPRSAARSVDNCTRVPGSSRSSSSPPRVICSLGDCATKLLRDDPAGITRVHGQPGGHHARTPCRAAVSDLSIRRPRCTRRGCSRRCARTSARLPELLAMPRRPPRAAPPAARARAGRPSRGPAAAPPRPQPEQLGLF